VDDYLYFYSEVLTDERAETEAAALAKYLELDRSMRILDLACGFGRHTNRLAQQGHDLLGIDLTPGFLELARQDAQRRGVSVDYRQGDMRRLDFEAEFDRVILAFTAFGYFSDDENLLVLKNIARALRPGGLVVFDSHNRDMVMKNLQPAFVMEKNGDMMIDRITFDTLTGLMTNRRIVLRAGLRKDKPFTIRYYNPTEITALLHQAGLQLYRAYGGWDGQEAGSSMRMVIVAQKPG
jgi:SAM-dependent methyltransferase